MSELRPRSNRSKRIPATARHARHKHSAGWTVALKMLAAALAVVTVSAGSVVAIAAQRLQDNVSTVTLVGEEDLPAPDIGAYPGGFNLLLVGTDACQNDDDPLCADRDDAALNDVNMVLHVSADHSWATVVSIPRDLVVPIPSCPTEDGGSTYAMSAQPINSTLGVGGLPCTVLTVEELTGLDIQFAGMITFQGVIEMSNAVGGVPVCIAEDIEDTYTGFSRPAGTHTLSGWDALAFLRSRHGVGDGSDLTRISSQQVFLSSLVRTLQSSDTLGDPSKLYRLAVAATQNLTLSDNLAQIDTMVAMASALKDIPLENVSFIQYPGTTGLGGEYSGKVAPLTDKADELFSLIQADQPFQLDAAGDDRGSTLDPNAAPVAPVEPAAPVEPEAPADPAAPVDPVPEETTAPADPAAPEVLSGFRGQTAADQTCSIGN